MIRWSDSLEEEARLQAQREGYRHSTEGYTGECCVHCGRNRCAPRKNGKIICEKCEWNQETGLYDPCPWE